MHLIRRCVSARRLIISFYFTFYLRCMLFFLLNWWLFDRVHFFRLLGNNVRNRQFYRKVHLVLTLLFKNCCRWKTSLTVFFLFLSWFFYVWSRHVFLALLLFYEIKLSISSILGKTTLTHSIAFSARKCHIIPFWLIKPLRFKEKEEENDENIHFSNFAH